MIDEKWKCIFTIKNVLLASHPYYTPENINSDNLKMEYVIEANNKNQLSGYIKGEIIINVKPMTAKHRIYKQAVENLFTLIGLVYVRMGGIKFRLIDPKIDILDIELINEEELRSRGQQTHADIKGYHEAEFVTGSYIEVSKEVAELYDKIIGLDENANKELKLSIRWFYNSVTTSNQLDKFINAWITFSLLYGWIAQTSSLYRGIEALINNSCPDINERNAFISKYLNDIKIISDYHLCGDYQGRQVDHAQELRQAIASNNPDEIFKKTFMAIGNVRNHLFHGDLDDKSNEAKLVSPLVTEVNAMIIKNKLSQL